jgi:hypothetical protein
MAYDACDSGETAGKRIHYARGAGDLTRLFFVALRLPRLAFERLDALF